jgi:hypothetical protein
MKPLILAALIAAPAFGQTITHISERDGYVIALGDAPCPGNPQMLEARFDSTRADQSSAAGCWATAGDSVVFRWFGDVRVALPVVLPASDFVRAKP